MVADVYGNGKRGLIKKVDRLGWQVGLLLTGGVSFAVWSATKLIAIGEQVAALAAGMK